MINKESTIRILKKNNLWAKKKFGQNFLISEKILDNIVDASDIRENDFILEVGPGLGFLTEKLSQKSKLVLAIEKDRDLVEYLRRRFKGSNIKVTCDNILFFDENNIKDKYKIVANLPYNITAAFLKKFLTSKNKPTEMILMVQKEVAERIISKPGNRERGFLTVMVEYYVQDVQIVEVVDRENFWPVPGVDSAVIKLKLTDYKQQTTDSQFDSEKFLKFVKMGFSQKRRQIHHPLKDGFHMSKDGVLEKLKKININPSLRAEELNLQDWKNIYREFTSK